MAIKPVDGESDQQQQQSDDEGRWSIEAQDGSSCSDIDDEVQVPTTRRRYFSDSDDSDTGKGVCMQWQKQQPRHRRTSA
jgi:hypothetical protein